MLWFACESRKTDILALGNSILHEKDFNNHRVCEIIKILGVYFGYDEKQRNDLNFRQTLKSIKNSTQMWKWRNLSLHNARERNRLTTQFKKWELL